MIELTLRYGFPAAHILSQPALSEAENWAIYDKCANPNGHGHNYEVEVTVTGPMDERTGRILSPDLLDRIFEERIESRFARTAVERRRGLSRSGCPPRKTSRSSSTRPLPTRWPSGAALK